MVSETESGISSLWVFGYRYPPQEEWDLLNFFSQDLIQRPDAEELQQSGDSMHKCHNSFNYPPFMEQVFLKHLLVVECRLGIGKTPVCETEMILAIMGLVV